MHTHECECVTRNSCDAQAFSIYSVKCKDKCMELWILFSSDKSYSETLLLLF